MSIRLDKIVHSTLHEAFKNYATPTGAIVIPADNIPNGFTKNYSTSISYTRGGTIANIFVENATNKYLVNGGTRVAGAVYDRVSTETSSIIVSYSSSAITVELSIFNGSGAPIVLIAQNIITTVVQYDAPITAI